MPTPVVDLTGQRFGILTVISEAHRKNGAYWHCRCDCGNETVTRSDVLRRGLKLSCRCLMKKHGRTPKHLYSVWKALRERCRSPKHIGYHNYGGRGITVCEEWESYEAFRDWALARGWRRGLQVNRINNDGNYSPDNCDLVTPKENCNNARHNRRLTWQGRNLSLSQWAEETGLDYQTLRYRLKHGWTVERTLSTPPGPGGGQPRG